MWLRTLLFTRMPPFPGGSAMQRSRGKKLGEGGGCAELPCANRGISCGLGGNLLSSAFLIGLTNTEKRGNRSWGKGVSLDPQPSTRGPILRLCVFQHKHKPQINFPSWISLYHILISIFLVFFFSFFLIFYFFDKISGFFQVVFGPNPPSPPQGPAYPGGRRCSCWPRSMPPRIRTGAPSHGTPCRSPCGHRHGTDVKAMAFENFEKYWLMILFFFKKWNSNRLRRAKPFFLEIRGKIRTLLRFWKKDQDRIRTSKPWPCLFKDRETEILNTTHRAFTTRFVW